MIGKIRKLNEIMKEYLATLDLFHDALAKLENDMEGIVDLD